MNKLNQSPVLLSKLFHHTLSDDPHIRAAAYSALANLTPDDSIISCLLNGLNDTFAEVRKCASAGLIKFGYLNSKIK